MVPALLGSLFTITTTTLSYASVCSSVGRHSIVSGISCPNIPITVIKFVHAGTYTRRTMENGNKYSIPTSSYS